MVSKSTRSVHRSFVLTAEETHLSDGRCGLKLASGEKGKRVRYEGKGRRMSAVLCAGRFALCTLAVVRPAAPRCGPEGVPVPGVQEKVLLMEVAAADRRRWNR
jgi:hypothetical protein